MKLWLLLVNINQIHQFDNKNNYKNTFLLRNPLYVQFQELMDNISIIFPFDVLNHKYNLFAIGYSLTCMYECTPSVRMYLLLSIFKPNLIYLCNTKGSIQSCVHRLMVKLRFSF